MTWRDTRITAAHGTARQRQELRMMTAPQTESLSPEGVRSLEVRWMFPGELAGVVAGWFARFPAETTRSRVVRDQPIKRWVSTLPQAIPDPLRPWPVPPARR
jgi:hypothetical protein